MAGPAARYTWGGTLREAGRDYLAPAARYVWSGTLRETGWDYLAPAAWVSEVVGKEAAAEPNMEVSFMRACKRVRRSCVSV